MKTKAAKSAPAALGGGDDPAKFGKSNQFFAKLQQRVEDMAARGDGAGAAPQKKQRTA